MSNQKRLDDILKRNDYVKLVPKLKERSESVAKMIREKMDELDLGSINVLVKNNSGGAFHCDFYNMKYDYPDKYSLAVQDRGDSTYYLFEPYSTAYAPEFDHAYNSMRLFLLNNAAEIIKHLGELEEKKVSEIQTIRVKNNL